MRFQVPQFIETETKIVGPMTLKQFLWVGSGAMLLFLSFMIFPLYIFIPISIFVIAIFGSLAFVKIDNIPLFNYVIYALAYSVNQRRYFFIKKETPIKSEYENFARPKEEKKTSFSSEGEGKIIFKMEKKKADDKPSLLGRIRQNREKIIKENTEQQSPKNDDSIDKALEQINRF